MTDFLHRLRVCDAAVRALVFGLLARITGKDWR